MVISCVDKGFNFFVKILASNRLTNNTFVFFYFFSLKLGIGKGKMGEKITNEKLNFYQ